MRQLSTYINENKIRILSVCIGLVYIWFGALKLFPGLSPAEQLAVDTITVMTFGLIPAGVSLFLLAIWEVLVGLSFITGKFLRTVIWLMLLHMLCTFTPLLFFPDLSFNELPYGFSLIGQYIFKNVVLIAAAFVIYFDSYPAADIKHG